MARAVHATATVLIHGITGTSIQVAMIVRAVTRRRHGAPLLPQTESQ